MSVLTNLLFCFSSFFFQFFFSPFMCLSMHTLIQLSFIHFSASVFFPLDSLSPSFCLSFFYLIFLFILSYCVCLSVCLCVCSVLLLPPSLDPSLSFSIICIFYPLNHRAYPVHITSFYLSLISIFSLVSLSILNILSYLLFSSSSSSHRTLPHPSVSPSSLPHDLNTP